MPFSTRRGAALACTTAPRRSAAITRPVDAFDLQRRRDHIELLAHILPDHMHRAPTAGTDLALEIDHNLTARQMPRRRADVAGRLGSRCARPGAAQRHHHLLPQAFNRVTVPQRTLMSLG